MRSCLILNIKQLLTVSMWHYTLINKRVQEKTTVTTHPPVKFGRIQTIAPLKSGRISTDYNTCEIWEDIENCIDSRYWEGQARCLWSPCLFLWDHTKWWTDTQRRSPVQGSKTTSETELMRAEGPGCESTCVSCSVLDYRLCYQWINTVSAKSTHLPIKIGFIMLRHLTLPSK
jgi:hypothetical protein